MQKQQIKECALSLYDQMEDHKKITPDLIMDKAGLDFETSYEICLIIWRRMHEEANKMSQNVLMTGI